MNKLAAILLFCLVPPLAALAFLGVLVVRTMALLSRIGYARIFALVLAAWIFIPFLAGRGVFGALPLWLTELFNLGYVFGAVGLPCLLGYWAIRWYLNKRKAQDPEASPENYEIRRPQRATVRGQRRNAATRADDFRNRRPGKPGGGNRNRRRGRRPRTNRFT